MHAMPLAGITNRGNARAAAADEKDTVKRGQCAPLTIIRQTETCSGAALDAAHCGSGTRLDRLATFGRQSALACVTTCLAAVQGMPWMM